MTAYSALRRFDGRLRDRESTSLSTTPSVQYTYSTGSNDSRLTGIVYPDGYTVGYNYASGVDGNVSRLTSLSNGNTTLESYTYLGLGTVVERNHPSTGANLSYITVGGTGDAGDEVTGLDRFGRVVDQRWANGNTTLAEYKYGYDANGNALYRQDLANASFSQLFAYDNLNQLSSYQEGTLNANHTALVGNSTANQSWGYDALGNWQSVTTNGTTQTRTANAQDEYTAVGSASPAYDAAGDMITDETGKQFAYDAWGRLVAVKGAGNATLETNSYDGLGRRITTTAGGTTTTLTYSSQWQVLEESVGSIYTRRYVWSPVYVDALLFRDTDTGGTGLTAAGTGYTRLWPMQDANYDVAALGDASGAVVERYDYTPFGVVTVLTATYASRTASLYVWTAGFQGMSLDSVSGLSDQRARWYSASLGRWVTSDPLGLGPDTNDYRFVGNGPGNGVDPSGLDEDPRTTWNEINNIATYIGRGFNYWAKDYSVPLPAAANERANTAGGMIERENKQWCRDTMASAAPIMAGSMLVVGMEITGPEVAIFNGLTKAMGVVRARGMDAFKIGERTLSRAEVSALVERVKSINQTVNKCAVGKPSGVTDPKLKAILKDVYSGGADRLGKGSTADALRAENMMGAGGSVRNVTHGQDAADQVNSLGGWLQNNWTHPDADAARSVISDLLNALKGRP